MLCRYCGEDIADNAKFCNHCGALLQPAVPIDAPIPKSAPAALKERKENIVTGIVGAILGAAIGGASIVLLNQIGFVSSLSGLLLAVCTLKGYELLGGKLSTTGLIVSILLMLFTPYIADRISWALVLMEAFSAEGLGFGTAFAAIPELLSLGMIEAFDFWKDLIVLYLFVILGAFSTVRGKFRKE